MIFIIEAFGGSYEDAWTKSIAGCKRQSDAEVLVDNLEKWLSDIRSTELPESLTDHDSDDDEAVLRRAIALDEFKNQVLIDMEVPEELHEWLLENWDFSYDCDWAGYRIKEVPLL